MRVSRSLTIKQMAMVASVSMAFVLVFCTILLFHFVQQSRFTTATQLESIARSVREPLSAAILKADIPDAEAILSRIQPAGIVSRADVNLAHNTPSPLFRFGISFNKLFDYLAAGKPVLSDFPCPYNPAVTYGAGLDVQHPDAASVARRVEEMAAMGPEERDKLSRNALRAAHDYDFKKLTEKLLDVIEHPVTDGKED